MKMPIRGTALGAIILLAACSEPRRPGPMFPQAYAGYIAQPYGTPAPWGQAPPAPPVAPAAAEPREPLDVAVLPISEDRLFRSERTRLREALRDRMASLDPRLTMVPFERVDAALRPVSKSGKPCADATIDEGAVASAAGWAHTDVTHLFGAEPGSNGELWVTLKRHREEVGSFSAPFPRGERQRALEQAITSLVRRDVGALAVLGALGGRLSPNEARGGTLRVCEQSGFDCLPDSKAWLDQQAALTACFKGEDERSIEVLFERTEGAAAQCELSDVHAPEAAGRAQEACLCGALSASGAAQRAGRRLVRLRYLAPDLEGKARPAVRLAEITANLRAEEAFHYPTAAESAAGLRPVSHLVSPGLAGLSASLARCAPARGKAATSLAALAIGDTGTVDRVSLMASGGAPETACIEKALAKATFGCTSDEKAASAKLAIVWKGASREVGVPK